MNKKKSISFVICDGRDFRWGGSQAMIIRFKRFDFLQTSKPYMSL